MSDPVVLAAYAEADRLVAGWACSGCTQGVALPECCHFAVTGREPQLWPNEWRVLERAIASRGVPAKKLRVVAAAQGTCPLLDEGRCSVYAARPFGCRTYFCDDAEGPQRKLPRAALAEIGRRIAAAAQAEDPRCDGPRRITAWLRR